MMIAQCLVLFLAMCHAIHLASAIEGIPRYELDALRDLFYSTNGRNWTWKGPDGHWDFDNSDTDPCGSKWQGVSCLIKGEPSNKNQYFVKDIELPDYRLMGTIPDSIGNFSELSRLDLHFNLLTGTIPDNIVYLQSLQYLSLFQNGLNGSIPVAIGRMHNISHLNLGQNLIIDGIPVSLSNLTLLSYLDLSFNNMSFNLPDFFDLFSNLTFIDLSGNRFKGTIPETLCHAAALVTLRMCFNLLEGSVPHSIGQLRHLTELQLQINLLNGTIPASLGQLSALKLLFLDFNRLSGSIPESLGNMKSLKILSLNNNQLIKSLPSSLSNMSQLSLMLLQSNYLTGSIPESFGQLQSLTSLNLFLNRLTGTIPASLGQLELEVLLLDKNQLQGSIPDSFSYLTLSMGALGLSFNALTGTVPSFIADMKHLLVLQLNSNQFVGSLPSGIGLLSNLTVFNTSSNYLTGNLDMFSTLDSLLSLGLGSNQFTGTIPEQFGDLRRLVDLDLSSNLLHGSLPASICNWNEMVVLDLAQNALTSSLPECISDFSFLQTLVGNDNLFVGRVPLPREMRYRSELILSNNHFSGSLSYELYSFRYVQLADNRLSGPLPLPNSSHMVLLNSSFPINTLILSNNKLTGSLPSMKKLEVLVCLILSNNKFSGGLDGVFPHKTPLRTVQLSHNQLTGTIPGQLFELPNLESFSVESNCLDGPIPMSICNSSTLKVLDLNGLHTASSCQSKFLGSISKAYISSSSAMDIVYDCLFSMPNITRLHLSGLGIEGSLPSELHISDTLVDLSLSYNFIPGPIPDQIQQRQFKNLDLSNNKLTGTLRSAFGDDADHHVRINESSLSLKNNRLSGWIPSITKQYGSIYLLLGNSFDCKIDKSDLPLKDSDAGIYNCGSNTFNVSYYVWLAMVALVIAVIIVVYFWQSKYASLRKVLECWSYVWTMINVLDTISSAASGEKKHVDPSIDKVGSLGASSNEASPVDQKMDLYPQGNDCVPIAERLYYFRKWNNYVDLLLWIASVCCAYLLVVMVPLYLVLDEYFSTLRYSYAYTVSIAYLSGATAAYILLAFLTVLMFGVIFGFRYYYESYMTGLERTFYRRAQRSTSRIIERFGSRLMWYKTLAYLAVIAFNFTIVVGVNVLFVFTVLQSNGFIVTLAQLVLSAFKLFWNGVVAPTTFRLCYNYLSTLDRNLSITEFFGIQLMVSLSNNILIPFISLIFVNPNCFYYFFISTVDSVESPSDVAVEYLVIKYDVEKAQFYPQLVDYSFSSSTDYQPPFVYNYQCSFSILKYYAPAFVYVCILASFVNPVLQLSLQYLHNRASPDTVLLRVVDLLLPRILKPVTHANVSEVKHNKLEPYFIANQLIVTVLTFYGIFLSFGVMFPPLGVAVLLTMYSIVYFAKYKVGRFLYNAHVQRFDVCFDVVEAESRGAVDGHLLNRSVRSLTVLSCLFYTFFIFDILGDDVGFYRSYWVLIVMPIIPVLLVAANNLFMDYLKHRQEKADALSVPRLSSIVDVKSSFASTSASGTVNSGRSTFRVQQINSVTLDMRNSMFVDYQGPPSDDWGRSVDPKSERSTHGAVFEMNPLTINRPSDSVSPNRPSITFADDRPSDYSVSFNRRSVSPKGRQSVTFADDNQFRR